jgi:hypothetical protein
VRKETEKMIHNNIVNKKPVQSRKIIMDIPRVLETTVREQKHLMWKLQEKHGFHEKYFV